MLLSLTGRCDPSLVSRHKAFNGNYVGGIQWHELCTSLVWLRFWKSVAVQFEFDMTIQHIPWEQLTDLAANRLSIDEVEQVRSHLAVCAKCASQWALLDEKANNNRTSETGREPSFIKHVVAVLNFDSRQLSPAFGIRSGQSVARQLLFSVGEYDLDLRVAPDDGAWVVSGQVLGECEHGQVELRAEDFSERASMNDLCEFYLPRVPPGSYSLMVYISNMVIEVPKFELRA